MFEVDGHRSRHSDQDEDIAAVRSIRIDAECENQYSDYDGNDRYDRACTEIFHKNLPSRHFPRLLHHDQVRDRTNEC